MIRTVATEGVGVEEVIREIARFREHFNEPELRRSREISYWKEWLLQLLQTRALGQVSRHLGEAEFERIAADVAARRKDPYTVVNQILTKSGADDRRDRPGEDS